MNLKGFRRKKICFFYNLDVHLNLNITYAQNIDIIIKNLI